jgi:hypothetical protein
MPRRELTLGVDMLLVGKPLHFLCKPQVLGPRGFGLPLRIRSRLGSRVRYRVRDRRYIWFHIGYIAVSLFLRRVRAAESTNLFSVPLTVLPFTNESTRDDRVDTVAFGHVAKLVTSSLLDEDSDIRNAAPRVTRQFINRPRNLIGVFYKHRRKQLHPDTAARGRRSPELAIGLPIPRIEWEPTEFSSHQPPSAPAHDDAESAMF